MSVDKMTFCRNSSGVFVSAQELTPARKPPSFYQFYNIFPSIHGTAQSRRAADSYITTSLNNYIAIKRFNGAVNHDYLSDAEMIRRWNQRGRTVQQSTGRGAAS